MSSWHIIHSIRRVKTRTILVFLAIALLMGAAAYIAAESKPVTSLPVNENSTKTSENTPRETSITEAAGESKRNDKPIAKNVVLTGKAYQREGEQNITVDLYVPKDHTLKAIWANYSKDATTLNQEPGTVNGEPTADDKKGMELHSVTIDGDKLLKDTSYFYQAVAEVGDEEYLYGQIATFQLP